MKRVILVFCITLLSSFLALAQSSDYKKAEFSVGYSNNQVETGVSSNNNGVNNNNGVRNFFDNRESFNGVEASAVGNVSRYIGIKGDFSAHYKSNEFDVPSLNSVTGTRYKVDRSLYNFLGGVQIKDNAVEGSRFRPFAHALVGVGTNRTKIDNSFFTSSFCQQPGVDCRQDALTDSRTGFAAALGGGIDIKANERISIRAIQVDYNPVRNNGSTSDNLRLGVGVVFH